MFSISIRQAKPPTEGISAAVLTENIRKYGHKNVNYIGDIDIAAGIVANEAQSGDLVITLGAGRDEAFR